MDPLSFTASLLAVLATTQASVKGLRKLNNYRNAPQEIVDLISELENLEALLKDVQTFVELHWHALHSKPLFDCIQRAALKIHDIDRLLVSKPFNISNVNKAKQALLVWVRYESNFIALRDDLRIIKVDMLTRLTLASA